MRARLLRLPSFRARDPHLCIKVGWNDGEGKGTSKLLFYRALALVACGGSRCVNERRSLKVY